MDPYVYPATSVLKNLRDIRDQQKLNELEAIATTRRLRELEEKPQAGKFDARHLQSIHHYVFQDVYEWAGEFRMVDISKGGYLFGFYQHIVTSLDKAFEDLKNERYLDGTDSARFANRGAHYLGEINAVHPFREGNGRAQREFVRQLAAKNELMLDWSAIKREEMIEASRLSFQRGNNAALEKLMLKCLRRQEFDRRRERGQKERGRPR